MPTFDIAQMKVLSRHGMSLWNQHGVDTVVAFLFDRGWRPPKNYDGSPYMRAMEYSERDKMKASKILYTCITVARFKDPVGSTLMGADKALKKCLKNSHFTSVAKELVKRAMIALDSSDYKSCREALCEINRAVGGNCD